MTATTASAESAWVMKPSHGFGKLGQRAPVGKYWTVRPQNAPKPMSTTYSDATAGDAEDISNLLRASWAATYGSFLTADELNDVARELHHPDLIRHQISNPTVTFRLARTSTGALVGVATAMRPGDEAVVFILRLYVLTGYQGRGIGSELLITTLAAFPKAQRIQLQVAEGNPAGLAFWTKRGFRTCGREETRVGDTSLQLISMERTASRTSA
jgi:ribosomal protein S18 acetylase RimI-like enzyme